MTDDQSRASRDILGIRPLAEAANALTQAAVSGASAFLGRICLPAAEEFGLLLRDKVRAWRARNLARILQRAEEKLAGAHGQAHPRVVAQVLESGSWTDADDVQEMWAGLLSSSVQQEGGDDSGIVFADLLSRITTAEARILRFVCDKANVYFAAGGELVAEAVLLGAEEVRELAGAADDHTLHRAFAHLHSLELTKGGFSTEPGRLTVRPSELGLYLYARCMGHRGDPAEFYGLHRP
jgi:hypothetical protein